MSQRPYYRTATGIAIGCAYVAPAAHMHTEAERIQSLLLRKAEHPITALGHRVAPWIALACLCAVIIAIIKT